MRRFVLAVVWLLIASPAFAQTGFILVGPGTQRAHCTDITAPVTNQTWCADGSLGPAGYTWFVWNGTAWVPIAGGGGGGTPGSPVNSVQFNDAGTFGGDASFLWNKTNNILSVPAIQYLATATSGVSPNTISRYTHPGDLTSPSLGNMVVQSGTTPAQDANVILGAFDMISTSGSAASGKTHRDRVSLYSGITGAANSGNIWSYNSDTTQNAASGNYFAIGAEIDFTNNNVDRGDAQGETGLQGFFSAPLFFDSLSTKRSTAGIFFSGLNSPKMWNRGIVFAYDAISATGSTFQDLTNGLKSIDIRGNPTFGIYQNPDGAGPTTRNFFAGGVDVVGAPLRMFEPNYVFHVDLGASTGLAQNMLYLWPSTPGAPNQVLTTDGAGGFQTLSWATVTGSGIVGPPTGSTQFNNGSSGFGGSLAPIHVGAFGATRAAIQSAITAAPAGGLVQLECITYNLDGTTLSITKSITLQGCDAGTVLVGGSVATAITVNTDASVIFRNFSLVVDPAGQGISMTGPAANQHSMLDHVTITGGTIGLAAAAGKVALLTVQNSTISGQSTKGVFLRGLSSGGNNCDGGGYTFINNVIDGAGGGGTNGIHFENSAAVQLTNNSIFGWKVPVYASTSGCAGPGPTEWRIVGNSLTLADPGPALWFDYDYGGGSYEIVGNTLVAISEDVAKFAATGSGFLFGITFVGNSVGTISQAGKGGVALNRVELSTFTDNNLSMGSDPSNYAFTSTNTFDGVIVANNSVGNAPANSSAYQGSGYILHADHDQGAIMKLANLPGVVSGSSVKCSDCLQGTSPCIAGTVGVSGVSTTATRVGSGTDTTWSCSLGTPTFTASGMSPAFTAAQNRAALLSMIAALSGAGGRIQLPAGVLNIDNSSPIPIDKAVTIEGANQASPSGTVVVPSDDTHDVFVVTTDFPVQFKHFTIRNDHPATAGAFIKFDSTSTINLNSTVDDVTLVGCFICVSVINAKGTAIRNSQILTSIDVNAIGILANSADVTFGGITAEDITFTNGSTLGTAIVVESGGHFSIRNNLFAGMSNHVVFNWLPASSATHGIIAGNSFDGQTVAASGIAFNTVGAGTFSDINIVDNVMSGFTTAAITSSAGALYEHVTIAGNTLAIATGVIGIDDRLQGVTMTGNTLSGSGTAVGINLQAAATTSTICGNTFVGTFGSTVIDAGTGTITCGTVSGSGTAPQIAVWDTTPGTLTGFADFIWDGVTSTFTVGDTTASLTADYARIADLVSNGTTVNGVANVVIDSGVLASGSGSLIGGVLTPVENSAIIASDTGTITGGTQTALLATIASSIADQARYAVVLGGSGTIGGNSASAAVLGDGAIGSSTSQAVAMMGGTIGNGGGSVVAIGGTIGDNVAQGVTIRGGTIASNLSNVVAINGGAVTTNDTTAIGGTRLDVLYLASTGNAVVTAPTTGTFLTTPSVVYVTAYGTTRAAIQAAITAAPDGGVVQLDCIEYTLDGTTLTINKGLDFRGCGPAGGANATILTNGGADPTLDITSTTGGVRVANVTFNKGLRQLVLRGSNQRSMIEDNVFYNPDSANAATTANVEVIDGVAGSVVNQWVFRHNTVAGPITVDGGATATYGLWINGNTDSCECEISGNNFLANDAGQNSLLEWWGSGDLRVTNNKFLGLGAGGTATTLAHFNDVGVATSELIIANNVFSQSVAECVLFDETGSSKAVDDVVIVGNQFNACGSSALKMDTTKVSIITISGNNVNVGNADGFVLANVATVGVDSNVLTGGTGTGISIASTVSNATVGANHVSGFSTLFSNSTSATVNLTGPGSVLANLGTPSDGSFARCVNCNPASNPCTSGGAGAFAIRSAGAWVCP